MYVFMSKVNRTKCSTLNDITNFLRKICISVENFTNDFRQVWFTLF